jgi:hypothetical protein
MLQLACFVAGLATDAMRVFGHPAQIPLALNGSAGQRPVLDNVLSAQT